VVGPANHFKYINFIHSLECVYKKPEGGEWNPRYEKFHGKLVRYGKFHGNNKTKLVPWHMQALKATMQQYMGGSVVWVPKVMGLPRFNDDGGYGEICKVCISIMTNIPAIVDFVGKEYWHISMPELEKILAFWLKRVKLALSLIMIMYHVHRGKVIHNNISPSNILLHFLPDHADRVYIEMCDWGLASCIVEDVLSMYGFPITVGMEKNKRMRYWEAPKLFYINGPPNSETSLERVQRRHIYTLEVDAYSVGKVAKCIWEEEWDKDLFCNGPSMNIFYTKLKPIIQDPKTRPS
jgi:serine/threonine protein kinase